MIKCLKKFLMAISNTIIDYTMYLLNEWFISNSYSLTLTFSFIRPFIYHREILLK